MKNNTFYSFSSECYYTFQVYGDILEISSTKLKVEGLVSNPTHDYGHVYSFNKRLKDQSHLFSFIQTIYDLHLTILSIGKITELEINKLNA